MLNENEQMEIMDRAIRLQSLSYLSHFCLDIPISSIDADSVGAILTITHYVGQEAEKILDITDKID